VKQFGLDLGDKVILTRPLSYMDFLNLWKDAALILTDGGGLQEETTALGLSCLTLRENTERPITCDQGTNTLVGTSPERIVSESVSILSGRGKPGTRPALWDGACASRIVDNLGEMLTGAATPALDG